jgi:hypothetical protein
LTRLSSVIAKKMLSQYSWGDFFKFILVLAIPYYAYVIIKYYREDIREWLSNRGQSPAPVASDSTSDDDDQPLFATTSYAAPVHAATPATSVVAAPSVSEPRPQSAQFGAGPVITQDDEDDDISGFDLSSVGEITRPGEQSLTEVVKTANRLVVDDQGAVTPADQEDQAAVKLANVINQQRGKAALTGFNFNR